MAEYNPQYAQYARAAIQAAAANGAAGGYSAASLYGGYLHATPSTTPSAGYPPTMDSGPPYRSTAPSATHHHHHEMDTPASRYTFGQAPATAAEVLQAHQLLMQHQYGGEDTTGATSSSEVALQQVQYLQQQQRQYEYEQLQQQSLQQLQQSHQTLQHALLQRQLAANALAMNPDVAALTQQLLLQQLQQQQQQLLQPYTMIPAPRLPNPSRRSGKSQPNNRRDRSSNNTSTAPKLTSGPSRLVDSPRHGNHTRALADIPALPFTVVHRPSCDIERRFPRLNLPPAFLEVVAHWADPQEQCWKDWSFSPAVSLVVDRGTSLEHHIGVEPPVVLDPHVRWSYDEDGQPKVGTTRHFVHVMLLTIPPGQEEEKLHLKAQVACMCLKTRHGRVRPMGGSISEDLDGPLSRGLATYRQAAIRHASALSGIDLSVYDFLHFADCWYRTSEGMVHTALVLPVVWNHPEPLKASVMVQTKGDDSEKELNEEDELREWKTGLLPDPEAGVDGDGQIRKPVTPARRNTEIYLQPELLSLTSLLSRQQRNAEEDLSLAVFELKLFAHMFDELLLLNHGRRLVDFLSDRQMDNTSGATSGPPAKRRRCRLATGLGDELTSPSHEDNVKTWSYFDSSLRAPSGVAYQDRVETALHALGELSSAEVTNLLGSIGLSSRGTRGASVNYLQLCAGTRSLHDAPPRPPLTSDVQHS